MGTGFDEATLKARNVNDFKFWFRGGQPRQLRFLFARKPAKGTPPALFPYEELKRTGGRYLLVFVDPHVSTTDLNLFELASQKQLVRVDVAGWGLHAPGNPPRHLSLGLIRRRRPPDLSL